MKQQRGRLLADAMGALLFFMQPAGDFTVDELAAALEVNRRRAYRWIRVGVDYGLVVPRSEKLRQGWMRTGVFPLPRN